MCVSMYIHLTSVISISFINCAVCDLSKTFFKKEGEILIRIGNEKYMLVIMFIRDLSSMSHDSYYIKNFLRSLRRYFGKNIYHIFKHKSNSIE